MTFKINASSLIASSLIEEPSPVHTTDAFGKDSTHYVTKSQLLAYGLESLPPGEAVSVLNPQADLQSISSGIKDFLDGVKVLSESGPQQTWVRAWEIHRPKIDGCTSTLERSSSTETDYSLTVSVFDI